MEWRKRECDVDIDRVMHSIPAGVARVQKALREGDTHTLIHEIRDTHRHKDACICVKAHTHTHTKPSE